MASNQSKTAASFSENSTSYQTLLKGFFFDQSNDLMAINGPTGQFILVSNSWERTLGWTVEEMTTKSFLDFIHPDDIARSVEATASLFQGKLESIVVFENRYIHKKGHYLTLAWSSKFSVDKNVILCSARNISDGLFITKQEMAVINHSNSIVVFNADSYIVDSNENFNKLFGYDKTSLKGKKHADLLPHIDASVSDIERWRLIVETDGHRSGTFNKLTNFGTDIWVQGTYNPIRDSTGKVFKVIFSFLDVTEVKTKSDNHSQQIEAVSRQNAILTFDLMGHIVSANENAVNLFQYPKITQLSHDDLIEKNKHNHLKRSNSAEWDELVSGRSKSGEFKYISGKGDEIYFRGFYNQMLDLHGRPEKIMLYGVDVTQENALIDKAKQIGQAIQKSTGVIEIDLQGVIISANHYICEMLNFCKDELIGKLYRLIFDDSGLEYKEFIDHLLVKCFNGEFQLTTYKWKTKYGKIRHVQGAHNPIFSASGKLEKILIYVIDITEAVETAEEVKRVQQELVDFVTNLSVGLNWVDETGKIIWANQAELDLLGYEKSEYIGRYLSEFHADEHISIDITARLARFETLKNYPAVLKTKTGALREVSISSSIYRKDGKFVHTRCWTQDVTQSRKIEREILKANQEAIAATRSKSQFLSNMSHEIRTPLNGVISMSASLLEDANLNEEQKEIVEIIVRSGEILMGIVNNILDFSKIEAGKVELDFIKFSLDAIRDVCFIQESIAKKKGVSLVSHLPEMSFKLLGDSGRVCQILMNLLNNSIKFTPTGGTVSLSYEVLSETDTNVTLKFVISDTGAGMSAETLKRIFHPFAQADKSTKRIYGGTGLGLCICKSLIDLMDGTIDVKSEVGEGSQFNVCLTFKKVFSSTDSTNNNQTFNAVDYSKVFSSLNGSTWARILVAEDNVTNQAVVKRLLGILKMDFLIVSNGQEAIDALKRERFDVVLMDCQMPVLDGFEATKLIRQDPSLSMIKGSNIRLPIIALTANVVKEDQEKCFAIGMNDYVSKPIRKAVLAEALMNNLYRANNFYAQIREYIVEMRDMDKTRLKSILEAFITIKTLLNVLKSTIIEVRDLNVSRGRIIEQFRTIGLDSFASTVENLRTIEDVERFEDNLLKMEILVKGNFASKE